MGSTSLDNKREQAIEILDEGLEYLEQGLEKKAGRLFFKSIEKDPTYADGYNHLANIAWRKGDWKQADALYRKALECGEPEIKGVPKGNFWLMLEARPFMRALNGVGLTAWKDGRVEEAIGVFHRMLALNPNDNQGVRYLIGALYHQLGDLEGAIKWYIKTSDDPVCLHNYGLALIQQDSLEKAFRILIHAIHSNPYIVPKLLKVKLPPSDWWHGTNLAEPDYARDYVDDFGSWWKRDKGPLQLLSSVWHFPEVQQRLMDFIATRRAVQKAETGEDRVSLCRAGDKLFSPSAVKRMAAKAYREY